MGFWGGGTTTPSSTGLAMAVLHCLFTHTHTYARTHLLFTFQCLLVNTHLLFPHNANSTLIRLRECFKILEFLEAYIGRQRLSCLPIVMCGDWNGPKTGQVLRASEGPGSPEGGAVPPLCTTEYRSSACHDGEEASPAGAFSVEYLGPAAEPFCCSVDVLILQPWG